MRLDQWRRRLNEGGDRSYASRFPVQAAAILKGIEFGVAVEYEGDRSKNRTGPNLPVSDVDKLKVDAVIAADVATGKKAGPFDLPPFDPMCISPIGAVPKRDSEKIRVIHHLSYPKKGDSVNAGIVEESFDLSSFGHAARAVRKCGRGSWLIKLDISSAYKQIPVRREDWNLMGFRWRGKYYYERVLPFGLRSSCRLWDLYASALHFCFMHLLDIHSLRDVIHYVDDFLFIVEPGSEAVAHEMLKGARALCIELGLPLAPEKTEGPTTSLVFLGILLDTASMTASLPAARLSELQRLIVDWGLRPRASVKELQSLTGLLNFACYVVRPGRFYLRRIIDFTTRIAAISTNHSLTYEIPQSVRDDLAWWNEFLPTWNGISLLYEREWIDCERIQLFTDACLTGFGATFGNEWFAGNWSPEEIESSKRKKKVSMPYLELFAVVKAAATWGASWAGKKIIFRCDCKPIVQAITKRSSKNQHLMHLLRFLSSTACKFGFDFRVDHIAGVTNIAADALSRHGDCLQFRAEIPSASIIATTIAPVPLMKIG